MPERVWEDEGYQNKDDFMHPQMHPLQENSKNMIAEWKCLISV